MIRPSSIQKIHHRVVGDIDILVAIQVIVTAHHPESFPFRIGYTGRLAEVGKSSVPVVPVEAIGGPGKDTGMTIGPVARFVFSTKRIVIKAEI